MDTDTEHQITKAIAAHGQWKTRLKAAIAQGTSDFDVVTTRADNRCDFGKWLQSGVAPEHRSSPHYEICRKLHAEFHQNAAEVLALALQGRGADAEAKMAHGSPFAHVSAQLIREMSTWQKAA